MEYNTKEGRKEYYEANKDRMLAHYKRYARNNRSKINAQQRKWRRANEQRCYFMSSRARMKIDLTFEEYKKLGDSQEWLCAICRRSAEQAPLTRGRLCIDHCHKTRIVRGLLCGSCNAGIGHFEDNISRIKAVIAYLEASSVQNPCR